MNHNIEQAVKTCFDELCMLGAIPHQLTFGQRCRDIITRHLTTHTQSIEEDNKRLREALRQIKNHASAIQDRHLYKISHKAIQECV